MTGTERPPLQRASDDPVADLLLRASNSERRAAAAAQKLAQDQYRANKRAAQKLESEAARRVTQFWGDALKALEVLSYEANDAAAQLHRDYSRKLSKGRTANLLAALLSIHARTMLTCSEVLCLARTGHPQGAYARFRTIQELNGFSTFILKHGEETARRFCDYAAIEIHAAELAMRGTGGRGLDDEGLAQLEERRNELVQRYGTPFGKSYGWAAHALKHNGPTLSHILKDAGSINPIYREASLWVHSSTVGVLGNTQSLGATLQFITGPNDDRLGAQLRGTALGVIFTTAHLLTLAPKDKSLQARCVAVLRLGQDAIDQSRKADARWVRMHPTYRTLPSEGR